MVSFYTVTDTECTPATKRLILLKSVRNKTEKRCLVHVTTDS